MCHFRLQSVKHEVFWKVKTEIIYNEQKNIYKIVFACQKRRLFQEFGFSTNQQFFSQEWSQMLINRHDHVSYSGNFDKSFLSLCDVSLRCQDFI